MPGLASAAGSNQSREQAGGAGSRAKSRGPSRVCLGRLGLPLGAPPIHTKPTHWPYGATAVPNRPPWVVRCALQGRWGHILENRVICRERAGKCSKCREQSRESSWFFPAGRSREKPGAKPGMPGASREKPGIREQAQKPRTVEKSYDQWFETETIVCSMFLSVSAGPRPPLPGGLLGDIYGE